MNNATDYTLRHGNGDATGLKIAAGLGWLSLTLGAVELFATRKLTRALGMRGNEPLVQLYGVREIVSGLCILRSKDPTPWIWARILGDALDIGTLAAHLTDENAKEANVAAALGNVALVTAADIYCARRLCRKEAERGAGQRDRYDYSDRGGFPQRPPAGSEQKNGRLSSENAAQEER